MSLRGVSVMKKVVNNALMLYLLTFSNYILYFLTIPYQTRILGPELFGVVGFATALGLYLQLFVSFGFTVSATAEVARCGEGDERARIPAIFSRVFYSQIFLILLLVPIIMVAVSFLATFQQHAVLFFLTFLSVSIAALMPDYIYRGTENMKAITIRAVVIRVIFTVLLFAFLKSPADYYMIPLFSALGGGVVLIAVYLDLRKKEMASFRFPGLLTLFRTLRESSMFFWSRIATNIYGATNTFIIGLIYGPASAVMGLYVAADKVMSAAKQGITPVVDAVYPNAVKNKSLDLIKRSMIVIGPILVIGSLIVWIFAYDLAGWVLGSNFREAGQYIRLLIPIVPITFFSLILGFPALTVIGKAKHANLSVIVASIFHVIILLILHFTLGLTIVIICYVMILTNLLTLAYRTVIILAYIRKANNSYSEGN